MKGLELLDQNPNVAKLIASYYLDVIIESLNDESLPEDFKEFIREQGMDNKKIAAIIDGNPRNLFEFFDEQEIYINVTRYKASDGNVYSVLDNNSTVKSSKVFNTRKEADLEGVTLAIKLLEEKLNSLEKTNEHS
jgi:hypothetical protein